MGPGEPALQRELGRVVQREGTELHLLRHWGGRDCSVFGEWKERFLSRAQRDGLARNWNHRPDCVGCLRGCQMQIDTTKFDFSNFTLFALIDTRKLNKQDQNVGWKEKKEIQFADLALVLYKNRLFLFYWRNRENILMIGKYFWNQCLSRSHLKDHITH